jgi:hypothetical protein
MGGHPVKAGKLAQEILGDSTKTLWRFLSIMPNKQKLYHLKGL